MINKRRAIGLVIYNPKSWPNILKIKFGKNITGLEKFNPSVEPPPASSKPDLYSVRLSSKPSKFAKNKAMKYKKPYTISRFFVNFIFQAIKDSKNAYPK